MNVRDTYIHTYIQTYNSKREGEMRMQMQVPAVFLAWKDGDGWVFSHQCQNDVLARLGLKEMR